MCRSEYIVLINDDCRVGPSTYERMIDAFDSPRVGIVGAEAGGRDGDAVRTAKGFLLAFRRSMLEEIGGYDEGASPLADERELGLRAAKEGWVTNFAEGAEYSHVHDISNHPEDIIVYMGEKISPKGENAFQHTTQDILDKKSNEHLATLRDKFN